MIFKRTPSAVQNAPKEPERTAYVLVKFDCGFQNSLYIRGSGAGLSWEQGQSLKNIAADMWLWETTLPFNECEFKVVLNDQYFELGENHLLKGPEEFCYTPRFGV